MNAVFPATLFGDFKSGLVVFFVALPLCLGIALASGAPLVLGLLAGIIGGLVVGLFSGSHTSVSGPAAGLSAVVAAQILSLGSCSAFLTAVILAGLIQIAFYGRTCLSVFSEPSLTETLAIVDAVARENVLRVVNELRRQSRMLDGLVQERRIAIVGAMYDVVTGRIEFLVEDGLGQTGLQKTA